MTSDPVSYTPRQLYTVMLGYHDRQDYASAAQAARLLISWASSDKRGIRDVWLAEAVTIQGQGERLSQETGPCKATSSTS